MSDPLFQLSTVYHGAPTWFETLQQNQPELFTHDAGVDHVRHYKQVAILQPYHADGTLLLQLLNFLSKQNLAVSLSGTTNYYPSRTFTIFVYRPEDAEQLAEFTMKTRESEICVPSEKEAHDKGPF